MFSIHKRCDAEIDYLRAQVRYLSDKCDRLTEALTKKDTSVVVRLPEAPMVRADNVAVAQAAVGQMIKEGPDQFVKDWFPQPKIATPPRERKVNSD